MAFKLTEYAMLIDGKDVFADEKFEDRSPINTDWTLAVMQKGNETHARAAMQAARKAFPVWSKMAWQKRVELLRKAASLIEERIFQLGAAMSLEVGKNRMEALGDVQETADLIAYSCDQMEKNDGFIVPMGKDPLVGYDSTNISVLRPYGVWLVVSPFNFPFALSGGPVGAALAAGNTVVLKPATDTPWIVRLLADCFRDAGLPDGCVNFVTGPGSHPRPGPGRQPRSGRRHLYRLFRRRHEDVPRLRQRQICAPHHPRTGRQKPGHRLAPRRPGTGRHRHCPLGFRPARTEMLRRQPRAGRRTPVYDDLVARLKELTDKLVIGDPTERATYLGPVINASAYK
jgi:1-pyrroline-5-carboxylate dehydrogenase